MKKVLATMAAMLLAVAGLSACTAYSGPSSTLKDIVKATPDSDHRDGICIVTKEQNAQGMESKTAKIDKWLGEIGF